jgi:hypothetical protein
MFGGMQWHGAVKKGEREKERSPDNEFVGDGGHLTVYDERFTQSFKPRNPNCICEALQTRSPSIEEL